MVESSTNAVTVHVAVHVEGAEAVGYGILVGEDQSCRNGKLGENFAHDNPPWRA